MNLNITDIDLTWSDPANVFSDYMWMKVIQVCVSVLVLILGTALILGMISFEKYGEDPQKRGLLNQLLSQLFAIAIPVHWILILIRLWRLLIGPFNTFLFVVWISTLSVSLYSSVQCIVEYSVIKFMSVVVQKRVLPVVDDFFGLFFWGLNSLMSFWLLLISSFTKRFMVIMLETMGLPDFIEDSSHYLKFR